MAHNVERAVRATQLPNRVHRARMQKLTKTFGGGWVTHAKHAKGVARERVAGPCQPETRPQTWPGAWACLTGPQGHRRPSCPCPHLKQNFGGSSGSRGSKATAKSRHKQHKGRHTCTGNARPARWPEETGGGGAGGGHRGRRCTRAQLSARSPLRTLGSRRDRLAHTHTGAGAKGAVSQAHLGPRGCDGAPCEASRRRRRGTA